MKVSVVTVVYNRDATIREALSSVLSQRGVEIDLVVQDGGSTDGTCETVKGFDDLCINFESAPDFGIYDAINRGITRTDGEIIGLMHSDDLFFNNEVLNRVVATFEKSNIDGVYGDLDYVSFRDPSRIVRRWRPGSFEYSKLARGWMPPHPTLYLRREVFEKWGAYDTEFRIAADYEAILRWLVRGKIRLEYIPTTMVKMRLGGESNRSLSNILTKSKEDLIAIRRHNIGGMGTLALKNISKFGQFF